MDPNSEWNWCKEVWPRDKLLIFDLTYCLVTRALSPGCDPDVRSKRLRKIKLYPARLQSDDAGASSSRATSTPNAICLLPLTEAAKDCKDLKIRKRWYFDPETGKCRKFRGCRTGGNNFGRKKRCKRKCIRKRRSPKRKERRTRNGRRRAKQ